MVDPRLSLLEGDGDAPYQLFQDGLATIVYCAEGVIGDGLYENEHVMIVRLPLDEQGKQLSTRAIMNDLQQERGLHHVMVEGGPATARAFLQEKLVDRAILIRAPISFREPFPSNMSEQTLDEAGLRLLGISMCDGDTVE